MVNEPIGIGDVCLDLAQGRTVQVQKKAADRSDEWSEENNYDIADNYANGRLGTTASDTVWDVVYCNSGKSKPSKTYAFPESRLLRIESEAGTESGRRTQTRVQIRMAEELLEIASETPAFTDALLQCLEAFDSEVASVAREMVAARSFGKDDGSGDDEGDPAKGENGDEDGGGAGE